MLFDDPNAPPAAPLNVRPAAPIPPTPRTPLFGLPLLSAVPLECGGCARFVALNPRCQVTGRCKIGIKPGFINRRTAGCLMHRPRGVPAQFQGRAVRP